MAKKQFRRKKTMTKQVIANKRAISKIKHNVERKFTVLAINNIVSTVGDTKYDLLLIEQGNDDDNRIGNKITLKRLNIAIIVKSNLVPGADILGDFLELRIICVVNKRNNRSTLANQDITEILINALSQDEKMASLYDPLFVSKTRDPKFKILFDKYITLNPGHNGSRKIFISKMLGQNTLYSGTTQSTDDIEKNSIILFMISNSTEVVWSINSIVTYTDT